MPTAPVKAGRGAGAYGSSPQTAVLGAVVMRGLAAVTRDRRLTSPQMRALLRQPDTADGHLRAELATIRRWDGDAVSWRRLMVFCDDLGCDAGEIIASHYASTRNVH
ncbi:hypothetical protein [Methylobacterium sp. J-067]|jgi:hypothetical protein|uniref:hypothetical protein n=1 Tax=Methylobacterium sp. J-067 TaxID=2836648 RepID=UPI001FBA6959|nr:hypothetical protein [Methylobacterium sp. J-067]MCJ2023243.1 hypothetical protein [Methylobacterium sp. J-067]